MIPYDNNEHANNNQASRWRPTPRPGGPPSHRAERTFDARRIPSGDHPFELGAVQIRLAWPLRKDHTRKSISVKQLWPGNKYAKQDLGDTGQASRPHGGGVGGERAARLALLCYRI